MRGNFEGVYSVYLQQNKRFSFFSTTLHRGKDGVRLGFYLFEFGTTAEWNKHARLQALEIMLAK
jgi:hypothetical protein